MLSDPTRKCIVLGGRFRSARREEGYTQKGIENHTVPPVRQETVSRIENGRFLEVPHRQALQLAEFLGMGDIESELNAALDSLQEPEVAVSYCPNVDCITSRPVRAGEHRLVYIPVMRSATPAGEKYCPFCGEVVVKSECQHCAAPLKTGAAVCPHCGEAYIRVPEAGRSGRALPEVYKARRDQVTALDDDLARARRITGWVDGYGEERS